MRLHKKFEPRRRKNYPLIMSSCMFVAAVAFMWKLKDSSDLTDSDMIMFTGIALMMIIFTVMDIRKKRELYEMQKELEERQDELGTDLDDKGNFYF